MKRLVFTFFMALITMSVLHAQTTYSGTIIVSRNGSTNSENITVTVTEKSNGLNDFVLKVPFLGFNMTLNMPNVPADTSDGITVYSAVRDVSTILGTMRTTLFARVTDGMMAADVTIPAYDVTMWFNTVGDHFQMPNSDMEDWNSSYTNEPNRWHGFKSAGGTFAGTSAGIASLGSSDDVRPGATGHSAVLTAGSFLTIVANGTMTNGKLMAGSYDANSPLNHAEMDQANGTDDFYMPLYAKPDKFNVWLKYTQGTANANNKASVSVKTFDGNYYQEPTDKTYTNLSGSIVGGSIAACDWTHFSFDFDYDSYAANNAATEAIFVTFSTNGNPGSGSKNDALYVDDIKLIYLAEMTDLRYKGATIAGWNPAVTNYNIEVASVPNLDDFTASVIGASAVVTKSMEQNADGSYRIAISVVSGDLQTATCYIINATVNPVQVIKGDANGDGFVTIADVTTLIDYLLSGSEINMENADVDNSGSISIADVTSLIDILLSSK